MKDLLLSHFSRYPLMQLNDMVKLICQSEFAGGHMIKNAGSSLRQIEDEYAACDQSDTPTFSAFEDIGGLYRAHVAALKNLNVSPATLNRLFVATANGVKGSMEVYVQKLRALRQCCEDGALPFSVASVDAYINEAQNIKNCPLFSHSEVYRAAYRPAYRVVKAAYAKFIDAFSRIDKLLESRKTVTVAIDGGSGSGKSTLASLFAEVYICNVFHMDDFFLPPARKTQERLSEPGGNVDYERFAAEAAAGLRSGAAFSYRPYCCKTGGYKDAITVSPKALNIVEGVYSLHPVLADMYNLKLFLKTDANTQVKRIKERSGEEMLKRFAGEWIPLENAYFEKLKIEQSCDLIFDCSI